LYFFNGSFSLKNRSTKTLGKNTSGDKESRKKSLIVSVLINIVKNGINKIDTILAITSFLDILGEYLCK
jgi:hypothetical protein